MDVSVKSESPLPAEAHYILQYGNKAAHMSEMRAKRHFSSCHKLDTLRQNVSTVVVY